MISWQEAGDPLVLTYVPQWAWLLVCSLPLLLLGVFLFSLARQSYAGRPRAAFWFWLTVVVLVPAAATVWAFRPTVFYAIAYGCEPGVVVLLLALAFQWVMLERYRRQIVFLPSFRRAHGFVAGAGQRRASAGRRTVHRGRAAAVRQQSAARLRDGRMNADRASGRREPADDGGQSAGSRRPLARNFGALLLASALGAGLSLLPPVRGDAPADLPDPVPMKRVWLSPDRLAQELDRIQPGVLVKLPLGEFEELVRQAALRRRRGRIRRGWSRPTTTPNWRTTPLSAPASGRSSRRRPRRDCFR